MTHEMAVVRSEKAMQRIKALLPEAKFKRVPRVAGPDGQRVADLEAIADALEKVAVREVTAGGTAADESAGESAGDAGDNAADVDGTVTVTPSDN